MDNIIKFPIRDVQNWNLIEKSIRNILDEVNPPDELVQAIIEEFKPIWTHFSNKKFSFSFSIPGTVAPHETEAIQNSMNNMMENIKKEFHETVGEALLETLKLVVEKHAVKYNTEH